MFVGFGHKASNNRRRRYIYIYIYIYIFKCAYKRKLYMLVGSSILVNGESLDGIVGSCQERVELAQVVNLIG